MFFRAFNNDMRQIFNSDIDKYNVLSWIIFNANYNSKGYNGLSLYQCYISSSVISKITNINVSKVKRILKSLEEDNYFNYEYKSKGGLKRPSIINCTYIDIHCYKNELSNKPNVEQDNKRTKYIATTEKVVSLDHRKNLVSRRENGHLSKKEYKKIYSDIVKSFNYTCDRLDNIKIVHDKREQAIDKLIECINGDLNLVYEAFDKVAKSDFLNGDNDSKWKANFDWIINTENFTKIIEGLYENRSNTIQIKDDANNVRYDKYGHEIV